jgi:hypothetical protein
VPTKRIRSAGNPGGPGHLWVKSYFIDPAPTGRELITDPETEIERIFIPSRLIDNAILVANDPTYDKRLLAMGGHMARALRDGDWNIIEGAFFDRWNMERNVCRPFKVPAHWTRFRAYDHGTAKPFSVGWWAIASEGFVAVTPGHQRLVIPRGAIVRYREWYGSTGEPDVGLKLTAEQIADGIVQREKGDKLAYGVADPAIFSNHGGPSIAERMFKRGVNQRRADNKRVPKKGAMSGWDQMRSRIDGDDAGPQLVVFSTCHDFLRTVPVMQHDADNAEDIDTKMEDHVADEARYACMSRPYVRSDAKPKPKAPRQMTSVTFAEMLKHHRDKQKGRE